MQEFDFRKNKRRLQRGEAAEAALGAIAGGVKAIGDVMTTMMTLRYGTSIYGAARHVERYIAEEELRQAEKEERERCYRLLARLKKDGLIDGSNESGFQITGAGKKKLATLKEKVLKLPPKSKYSAEEADSYIVVTFDVPETKRKARDWLRAVLEHLEFQMIHRSVWIGKHTIPKELLLDLKKHHIIDHVEVLGVEHSGSIKFVDKK